MRPSSPSSTRTPGRARRRSGWSASGREEHRRRADDRGERRRALHGTIRRGGRPADAAGVLDAYGIPAAHVVGVSMGAALAQLLALDDLAHVLSIVLISASA